MHCGNRCALIVPIDASRPPWRLAPSGKSHKKRLYTPTRPCAPSVRAAGLASEELLGDFPLKASHQEGSKCQSERSIRIGTIKTNSAIGTRNLGTKSWATEPKTNEQKRSQTRANELPRIAGQIIFHLLVSFVFVCARLGGPILGPQIPGPHKYWPSKSRLG